WEASDGGTFLAMPMAGDIDISAHYTKGPTEDDDGGGWELGGPMIRESLDSGSRFAMAQLAATNALQFKRRNNAYAPPTNTDVNRDDNTVRPITMELIRKGDKFSAFYTEEGKAKTNLGDPDTLDNFAKTPYVGLFLSGHTEGEYSEADIDN